ncbi:hypothetical protein AB6D78_05130 [Vibrio splendidus]
MSLEQQIASLVDASNNLTGAVNGKTGEIDKRMEVAEKDFDGFKIALKKLIPAINLLPDPGFQASPVGLGVPAKFGFSTPYGAVATVEVADLTEQDKSELKVVLGNDSAFSPKSPNGFWPNSNYPKKVVITQSVKGTSSSSVRFSCPAVNVLGAPIYMKLVSQGGFSKKGGEPWKFGPVPGMYFTKGDIDDGNAFQASMNGITVWEIFMPFLTFHSDEMVYSNVGGNK